nr:MAG TPA: hypothetical protein [Caudoviricetes sp.]
MIGMTARLSLDGDAISYADLMTFALAVNPHKDAVIGLDYADDSVAPVALEAYWEVCGDDSQQ